jgi:hypothetical protein
MLFILFFCVVNGIERGPRPGSNENFITDDYLDYDITPLLKNFHLISEKPQVQAAIVHNQHKFDTLYSDLAQPGAYTQTIKLYLRKNETHSLHRPKRKKFPSRSIITHYPGQIIQSDLIDMRKYSTNNNRFNYILVVIDCFSKYLWCVALKNKSAFETSTGLRTIFSKMKYPVQTIIFDQGLEYVNLLVNNLLKERRIYSYHILTKNKASSAERVNQTIKKNYLETFHSS